MKKLTEKQARQLPIVVGVVAALVVTLVLAVAAVKEESGAAHTFASIAKTATTAKGDPIPPGDTPTLDIYSETFDLSGKPKEQGEGDKKIDIVIGPENLLNPQQIPDSSFIYDTSIASLQTADPYMDGQTIQIRGEVVGDRIRAEFNDTSCWLTLQAADKSHAEMTVYVPLKLTESIDTYGAYGKHGTTIQARGTFNLACDDHNGLTDLHASYISIITKGFSTKASVDLLHFTPGILLVVAGCALLLLYRRIREGRR